MPGFLLPDWPAPPNIRTAVTTRGLSGHSKPPFDSCNLGIRCGDDPATVRSNREILARRLELPAAPCWLQQVHGAHVVEVPRIPEHDEPRADAAYSNDVGTVLAILTADCLPVLLCDRAGQQVGAVHAGWRGLCAGVIEACVAKFSGPRDSMLAWLGPAIAAPSYEVGAEVRDAFIAIDAAATEAFVATRVQHWRCDLYLLARQRLRALGIESVSGGDLDTFTDPRFYSYRRAPATGRFASLIWRQA